MRVVYEAENLIDAHLVKGALEDAGIPAFVRGEYLTGAMGELPVSGMLAVCVPEVAWPEATAWLASWSANGGAMADEGEDGDKDDLGFEPA